MTAGKLFWGAFCIGSILFRGAFDLEPIMGHYSSQITTFSEQTCYEVDQCITQIHTYCRHKYAETGLCLLSKIRH